MMTETGYCVVLTTCATDEEAAALAGGMVEARLAACVQVLPITSFYTWQGRTERGAERLLLIKTPAARYAALERHLRDHHPYEVPEILRLPVVGGLGAYLAWMDAVT